MKYADWFDGNSMELEEFINNRNLARNNMFSNNTKFYSKIWEMLPTSLIEI